MERSLVLLFLVGAILFVDGSYNASKEKIQTEELNVDVKEKCYLDVFETQHINCEVVNDDQRSVPHGERCTIENIDEEPPRVEELICNNGHWSGTDYTIAESRHRRFIGLIIFLIAGAVGAVCAALCHRRSVKRYRPELPRYCKPKDVREKYYIYSGKTSIRIDWTVPTAYHKKGYKIRVKQTDGIMRGGWFPGSVAGKTHYIRYEAKDTRGLTDFCVFHFTVYVKTCDAPYWPRNSKITCDDKEYKVGSECRYSCNNGYKLTGSSKVTCQKSLSWSTTPYCKSPPCSPPPYLANGKVSCDNYSYSSGTVCYRQCNRGYTLRGPSYTKCLDNGVWSSKYNPTCTDNTPPILTCKTPQIFYADKKGHHTSVTWKVPTAKDFIDPNPMVVQTSGPSQKNNIDVGSVDVQYKAVDRSGNYAKCTIELQVKEITCGHPRDTLQDKLLDIECSGAVYRYGVQCNVSCLFNLPLNGSDIITCERNGTTGVWSWGNSYMPNCRKITCPDLNKPINGAIVIDAVQTRPAATMMCNEKYDIPDFSNVGFTGIFLCLDNKGWTPIDYAPDCIEVRNPRFLNLPGEIYYYSGNCGNEETNKQIRKNYIDILESNALLKSVCPEGEQCAVNDVVISCGPIQNRPKRNTRLPTYENIDVNEERKKRSSFTSSIKTLIKTKEESSHGAVKRQVRTHRLVVRFKVVVNITIQNNETLKKKMDYYDNIMTNMSSVVQTLLNNESLDIDNFITDVDSWKPPKYGDLECSSGYILKKLKCKPCPAGHFLNESSGNCQRCPIGQYYKDQGGTGCLMCPTGYTTKQIGSKSIDNCTEICHPGSASPDGMLPCAVCLYGEYQDEYGQTSCKQCPSGTTTKNTNSTSSQDCHGFDVLIEETDGPISLATLPSDINDMSLSFWVKRYDEQASLFSLQVQSEGNDTISLYLTENVIIRLHDHINETVAVLTSTKWTNVLVILSSSDNSVKVFINGNQVCISSVSLSAPVIKEGEIIVTAYGSSGVYIAGLHLFDKVLKTSEISLHVSSCHVIETNDVFNMSLFEKIDATGINVIPSSSCDADDNCDPDPCNGHRCIDGQNRYTCLCFSGWSGDNCTVPPDYCIDNSCENGATCVSLTTNYTCYCLPGFTGSLCEIPPVDGGWSEWAVSSLCNKQCGTGSQNRTRSCNSPTPDLYGKYCVGESEDTIPCNTQACLVCDDLELKAGTLSNCTTDGDTGDQLCTVYCEVGKIMQPGYPMTVNYSCGPSNLYKWNATELMPSCVDASGPKSLSISTSVKFKRSVREEDKPALINSMVKNFQSTPCSDECQVNVNISDTGTATISYSLDLKEGPDLDIASYVSTGQVSPPLQELVDSMTNLELTAQHLKNNTSDMFNTSVNGESYSVDESSLSTVGVVQCPDGQIPSEGACVYCPAGTYSVENNCDFCEKGSYQPEEGKSSCVKCPTGLTTVTEGSTNLSNCLAFCPSGSYANGSNCILCEKGRYQPFEAQSSCRQCPTGLTTETVGSNDISNCIEIESTTALPNPDNPRKPSLSCPAGAYSEDNQCIFCVKGSYQPKEGQSSCIQCPSGLTTVTVGSTDSSNCLVYCSAGSYSGGNQCISCEKGSYQSEEGQSYCIQCPPGLITMTEGSTDLSNCLANCSSGSYADGSNCLFCEKGSYQPLDGQSSCIQCPTGLTTMSVGSTNHSNCLVYCPAGSYSDGNRCLSCEQGSYQPEEGQSSCMQCPPGLITVNKGSTDTSNCLAYCPSGSYADGNSCFDCEKGSYQPLDGQSSCLQCPTGLTTETVGSNDISHCADQQTKTTSPSPDKPRKPISDTVIIAVVTSVVALIIVCTSIVLLLFKKWRNQARVNNSSVDLIKIQQPSIQCSDIQQSKKMLRRVPPTSCQNPLITADTSEPTNLHGDCIPSSPPPHEAKV